MREAVYVLRGEIDESVAAEESLIVIRAELVDVQSRRVVASVELVTKSANVADSVTEIAAELSSSIANGAGQSEDVKQNGAKEVDRLYELVLRDVFRFVRYLPDDAGYIPFLIPGVERPRNMLAEVDPTSPLGVALLQKSIDRLESVLFIAPERLTAVLPLAYCLSFHVDGVWRPAQCEALLRRVHDERATRLHGGRHPAARRHVFHAQRVSVLRTRSFGNGSRACQTRIRAALGSMRITGEDRSRRTDSPHAPHAGKAMRVRGRRPALGGPAAHSRESRRAPQHGQVES